MRGQVQRHQGLRWVRVRPQDLLGAVGPNLLAKVGHERRESGKHVVVGTRDP